MTRPPRGRPDGSAPPPAAGADKVTRGPRPAALAVVCALVVLQAVLLVGLAGAWVVDLVRGAVQLPAATVFLALFALGIAAVLVLGARGLWQGRRWARAPVTTWQILLVVMAVGWLGSDPAPWAVAVLVGALAVVVGLHLRPVVAATMERPGD